MEALHLSTLPFAAGKCMTPQLQVYSLCVPKGGMGRLRLLWLCGQEDKGLELDSHSFPNHPPPACPTP